jgi:hypothetical protein
VVRRLGHKHDIKKTHVTFVEYDDVNFDRLSDTRYFGEGNSKGRKLAYDFEYCLSCDLRLLNGEPVMTRDILGDEFERFAVEAKRGNYKAKAETTMQHTDFDALERLINAALGFGKLKESQQQA